MSFSEYIVYVDEAGDHGLASVDADFPVFVLAFCIFDKQQYINQTTPAVQQFKFNFFGHDMTILHEREIRKSIEPFNILQERQQVNKKTHIVFECRGKKEDNELELEFRRLLDQSQVKGMANTLDIIFADKKVNSTGLQLADMVARPIGRHIMDAKQANRAFDIIETKFRRSPQGKIKGWGLKCYP